mmetsp:Transcript_29211/g.85381  ORF Transcript_29211/g.85381 Transcript_29211/m.85381 type:complete len:676 (+) Transcript_29211:74-2101(+)
MARVVIELLVCSFGLISATETCRSKLLSGPTPGGCKSSLVCPSAKVLAEQNFLPPMVDVFCCMDEAVHRTDSDCGPATRNRTVFAENKICTRRHEVLAGNRSMARALEGLVLDIALLPTEDETPYGEPANGDQAFYHGLVGDVINLIAREGGFTWRAVVIKPPKPGDAYDGSRDEFLVDWTNRVDLIAACMFMTPSRLQKGVAWPYPFYDLSPVLLVQSRTPEQKLIDRWAFFMKPFSNDLWLFIFFGLFLFVGLLDDWNDAYFPRRKDYDSLSPYVVQLMTQVAYGWWSAFMSFIAVGGLGYSGEIGGKDFAGSVLKTAWAGLIWIIRSCYTAGLAVALIESHSASVPYLTSDSLTIAISRHNMLCTRNNTAIDGLVKGAVPLYDVTSVQEGDFDKDLAAGSAYIRNDTCVGMVQPLWMAQDALLKSGGVNDDCDLRISYPIWTPESGGYVTASAWRRDDHLIAHGVHEPGCNDLILDAMTLLMLRLQIKDLRDEQLERHNTNRCGRDGAPRDQHVSNGTNVTGLDSFGGLFILAAISFVISFVTARPSQRREARFVQRHTGQHHPHQPHTDFRQLLEFHHHPLGSLSTSFGSHAFNVTHAAKHGLEAKTEPAEVAAKHVSAGAVATESSGDDSTPAVQQRLSRLEDKVDAILRALEKAAPASGGVALNSSVVI